ncbi:MAG: RluA family pseudouridine synthase [Clostridia bacterium]|nr:RluA family pseudouridine synthase [Clostridia bacterium]
MDFLIDSAHDGKTVRSYIKFTLHISSRMLTVLKQDENGIVVNGTRETVRHVLHEGDVLSLARADRAENASHNVPPSDIPLDIIYEDAHVIALNKPPYMPTHPSHNHHDDTLANALAWRYAQAGEPFVFRPMGRLDRNTSGIVLAAKDKLASGMLTAAIREGEVNKTYIAIAVGELPLGTGVQTIDCGIRRQAESVIMRTTCPDSTAPDEVSVTDYEVLDTRDGLSLVRVRPRTGRTHQIRVHFAYIGHPLLGDDLYGTPDERIGRHALHAQSLELPLPFADRRICLQAPMAEDMLLLIKQYFPRYS